MGMAATAEPQNLVEAIRYFSDPERAFQFVSDLRWPDGRVTCPRCGHGEVSFLSTRRIWKCLGCRKQFSLKVGTIFEDSPLGWDKWLPAVWLIANAKNSISSHELARSLGVTQKSAWFMLHRIREAMATGTFQKMDGITEVDDTYIGGLAKNMHHKVRRQRIHGPGGMDKMVVQGARNRDSGTVTAAVIDAMDAATIQEHIYEWVEPGSALFTDTHKSYEGLDRDFAVKQVNHSKGEYVSGIVHTNGIENFWSLLKRSLKGTQIHVDRAHLGRYVTERTFAYNHRDAGDLGRMRAAVAGAPGRRLTWAELTDHSGITVRPRPERQARPIGWSRQALDELAHLTEQIATGA
jgi:transposase-like protein